MKITLALATVIGLLIAVHDAAQAASSIAGVYALQDPGRPFAEEVVANPNVDGLALRYQWKWLEPQEGTYDWSQIDRVVQGGASRGKKISISMVPGWGTPEWVYQAGAARYTYMVGGGGPEMGCRQVSIPVPWDPVFMAKWSNFIRAAGAHYNNNPAVVSLKVLGINANTPEMILPHAGPWSKCPNADQISDWQKAGYTRTKLMQTWTTMAGWWAGAFPSKSLILELVPGGMPPIDDKGQLMQVRNPNGDVSVTQEILQQAAHTLGSQLVVQNDGLSGFWSWEAMPQLEQRGITVGYQMLWSATGDRQCRMNRGQHPCDDPSATLSAAVNRGIETGARYLEIYPIDIRNTALQGIIADAHRRLTGGGSKGGASRSFLGD